jgi:hypothetical protein
VRGTLRYFAITIDVEPDCTPSWHYSNPLTFEGIQIGIKERLQPLFNRYKVLPTYLINNVVMEDEKNVDTFLHLEGEFELGTHLHPEFIEPDKVYCKYDGIKAEANQCFLPPAIELAKMENITNRFIKCFGRRPLSFRAGRFSAGTNTISSLQKLGYKIDTSITPHINWADLSRQMPVDYTYAPEQPFFIGGDEKLKPAAESRILEIPVSIRKKRVKLFRTQNIWLRPFHCLNGEIKKTAEYLLRKYKSNKVVVLNMMFHNIELVPGKSPYTQTQEQCSQFLELVEEFIVFCCDNNIKSSNLSGLYDVFEQQRKN